MNWNSVWWENFVLGRLAAKAEQKSLVPAQQAQRINQGRTPVICTLWVTIICPVSTVSSRGHPFLVSLMYCRAPIELVQHSASGGAHIASIGRDMFVSGCSSRRWRWPWSSLFNTYVKKQRGNLYGWWTITCKQISPNHVCKLGLNITFTVGRATGWAIPGWTPLQRAAIWNRH